MKKLFIVTLKDSADLQNFYDEMENIGTRGFVPQREVDISLRRTLSRNTHYYLTENEAQYLKQDPRVLDVSLPPDELGITLSCEGFSDSGNYKKSYSAVLPEKNWGLWRITNGKDPLWGSDAQPLKSSSLSSNLSGKGVDVIICDSGVKASHPEFAKNLDGTGGSRVQQIDWFQFNSFITSLGDLDGQSLPTGTYDYSFSMALNSAGHMSSHGTHVAGTACGNTQGWARDCNIYDISFGYPVPTGTNWNLLLFDYIRAFHLLKQKECGIRRPTIVNHSWGANYSISKSSVTFLTYRGTNYSFPFSDAQLLSFGLPSHLSTFQIPARYTPVEADIQDAINDGIIQVSAAGNQYLKISTPSDPDWNNSVNGYYYNRGGYPYATGDTNTNRMIVVGALSASASENKASFSNCGPRVDTYVPGEHILSSHLTRWGFGPKKHRITNVSTGAYSLSDFDVPELDRKSVLESRGTRSHFYKSQGTSMASPQVTGILACLLERYPHWTQSDALSWIQSNNELDKIGDPNGLVSSYSSLRDGSASTLRVDLQKKKNDSYGKRGTSGTLFPRRSQRVRSASPILPSFSLSQASLHLFPTLYNTGTHTVPGHSGSDTLGSFSPTLISTRSVANGYETALAVWGAVFSDGREASQYQYSWNGTSASLVSSDSLLLWNSLQLQWQISSDGSLWNDLTGENDSQIFILCDATVNGKYYRCRANLASENISGFSTIMKILVT